MKPMDPLKAAANARFWTGGVNAVSNGIGQVRKIGGMIRSNPQRAMRAGGILAGRGMQGAGNFLKRNKGTIAIEGASYGVLDPIMAKFWAGRARKNQLNQGGQ